MDQQKYYAVLTGDVVKSSHLSKSGLETVRSSLRDAVSAVKGW